MPNNDVSTLDKCQTVDAKKLCIFDIDVKLKTPGLYNIGGTYTNLESDLWFFYYTSLCPGYKYLLNLFVCHRKPGIISVGVSKGNELIHKNNVGSISSSQLPAKLEWKILRAAAADEESFIKTFCFTETDLAMMKNNTLVINLSINVEPKHLVCDDLIKMIKLQHDFGKLLSNKDKTDLVLKTPSQKEYNIHRIVLAAHSPVLRALLKDLKEDSMFIDISDNDIDLLLQFLYTGTIKDLFNQNCLQLLEIADRFQLKNLFRLTQYAITTSVTVDNAIEVAKLADKYKLDMQLTVFNFIKQHPEVMLSEGWKNLNDVNITKKLLEYVYKDNEEVFN